MKNTIAIAWVGLSLSACANPENKNTTDSKSDPMKTKPTINTGTDKKAVQDVAETLFKEVDNRAWEKVINTMADSVYTDYTALGGDAGFKSPQTIVEGWQSLLPGFERTVHNPHNFAVWIGGDRATATLDAIATHYLDNDYWTVFVGYDTEYVKGNDGWKLARIDISLYNQTGNQSLPQAAAENVKNGTIPALKSAQNTAALEQFFTGLEERNLDKVLSSLSKDVIQDMPFAPANFPKSLNGIDAMQAQYTGVMDYTQAYEREYFGTANPNVILAKFKGTITTGEGKPYNNSYVGIYTISGDGKIEHFVEQFNPNILLSGWPGLQSPTFSVHAAGARTDSGVTMEEVQFSSNGVALKGHLFLPPGFDPSKKYPGTIVTGSWTSVKEQMPDEYASLIAKEGFVALTFDFTGFGQSEGQPRQVEDYKLKIVDIKAAVDFMESHDNVDMTALTGLGVCASSGYMAHATAQDSRIKNLVLVAPWLHNEQIAKSIYDMRPGGTEGLLNAAKNAKEKYAVQGEMDYVLAASELDPLSAMYVPANAFDYYLNPAKAAGKYYDNRFAVSSWEPWLTFDGISAGNDIEQPVFIVHSESGAVPQGTKDFYQLLKGKKEIKWLNDYNQQQLYFEEKAVNAAMSEVVSYLNR